MSRRPTDRERRRLSLRRETLRKLDRFDLGQVAGGTEMGTWGCDTETLGCDTGDCWLGTNSRFC